MAVAQEEIGGVHQHMAIAFRGHCEAPQDGLREGVRYRCALRRIAAGGAERFVALHQEHARSHAMEGDDPALSLLPAVQPDIVGAEARGKTGGVQELGIEARNLQVEIAGALVPIKREVAVQLLHAGGAFFNRGNSCGRLLRGRRALPPPAALLRGRDRRERQNGRKEKTNS